MIFNLSYFGWSDCRGRDAGRARTARALLKVVLARELLSHPAPALLVALTYLHH